MQKVTLELSDDVIQHADTVAQRTGRSLEAVLADWIEREALQDNTTHLLSAEQYLYTPLGGEDTAQALYEFLQSKQRAKDN